MDIRPDNTDFIAFYVGISDAELREIEQLIESFDRYFDHTLTVLDMSKATHKAIENDEPLWMQHRAFTKTANATIDVTPEDSDELFDRYADTIERIEEDEYCTRSYRTNKALYEYSDVQFSLLLDSDIKFTNGEFFVDVSSRTSGLDSSDFGAMGKIISPLPFGIDENIFGSRDPDVLKRTLERLEGATNWLNRLRLRRGAKWANYDARGVRRKGSFPRFGPEFLLLNREQYTDLRMNWDILYLDVDDYSSGDRKEWRIIGDEGADVLYEMAKNKLSVLNVDYTDWAEHDLGSWGSNTKMESINWYYLGRDQEGSDRDYWEDNEIPDELLYDVPE